MRSLRPACVTLVLIATAASAAEHRLALDSAQGLTLHHADAAPVTFKGRRAVKLTAAAGAATPAAPASAAANAPQGEAGRVDHLGIIENVAFGNGTIEVDLAGSPGPGAGGGARGFVGVAFRVQPDRRTYDCFYLRPTNGRADDQERRNHAAQYISHPEHPWFALREKTPSRYESYVDVVPDEWIHIRIEVNGDKARLYVNGNSQPTLVVNDVKSGPKAVGAVALWFEGSTIAHFANLKVTPR